MGGYRRNRRKFQYLSLIVSPMPTISWSDDCQVDEYSQRMIETLVKEKRASTSELAENSNLGNTDSGRRKVRYRLDEHLIPGGLVKEIQSADRERVFAQTDGALDFLAAHADEIRESKTLDSVDETAKSALEIANDASETVDERVSSIAGKVGSITQKVEELDDRAPAPETFNRLEMGIDEIDETTLDLKSRINEVEEIQRELQSDLEELRSTIDEDKETGHLDQQLKSIEEMVDSLESDLSNASAEIERIESTQESLKVEIDTAEYNREILADRIETLQRRYKKAIKERNKLSEQQDQLRERVKTLEEQGAIDFVLGDN
jgi:chromosome segregation ATPase